MQSKQSNRRRFLKEGAAAAGLAVGAIRSPEVRGQTLGIEAREGSGTNAQLYGDRSRFLRYGRLGKGGLLTPLHEQAGIITPAALHYVINHGPLAMNIDPQKHQLLIHGMVDRPLVFQVDELKRLPSVSRIHFIECATNTSPSREPNAETIQERMGRTSCSLWTGVPVSALLREAGVQKGASWLVADGVEAQKHNMSIPLDKAMDDCMVAYGQNGEPVRPENGFPLRLIVPGWEGVRNVKYLRQIKVLDQPAMTYQEAVRHPSLHLDGKGRWFEMEMGPKSVITFPCSGGRKLSGPGFYEITGLAWSGGGVIRRVEVSTDGGKTWKDAEIQQPALRIAHTWFHMDWEWRGDEVVLQSRCTDERGAVQPSLAELGKIWGVKPDFWRTTAVYVNHFNTIQRWRITRDGSVHNAVWDV